MRIVFVEYKVDRKFEDSFSSWASQMTEAYPQFELFEGTDQPGLFVEIWNGLSDEEYLKMQEGRQGEQSESGLWGQLEKWVSGGREKIHIWQFKKVNTD